MPREAKPRGDATEDLATKGALFDIETAEGTVRIVLPALEPDPESEPER
ncbi:MAG: hypothetical protein QOI47_924 [Actinomycetota bacterium]|jgi:hypothetical protein|nr:hypothetical protein [Actinomycetota bacterium]